MCHYQGFFFFIKFSLISSRLGINEGIILNNFNVSIITPIEKKDTGYKHSENFRPISVSYTFSNIFEILLDKMEHLFKFSNKQFGYKSNTSCKHA
jgi:hypothetical protein